MSIQERINSDYLETYKAHNESAVSVLRLLKTALKNAEINKREVLNDDEAVGVVKKEIKQREQAIVEYNRGGNHEMVQKEKSEAEFLSKYLPEQLSLDEIRQIGKSTLEELAVTDPGQAGRAIGAVMAKIKGRADGTIVAQIIRELIGNQT